MEYTIFRICECVEALMLKFICFSLYGQYSDFIVSLTFTMEWMGDKGKTVFSYSFQLSHFRTEFKGKKYSHKEIT